MHNVGNKVRAQARYERALLVVNDVPPTEV
jgi:hypothetical protein